MLKPENNVVFANGLGTLTNDAIDRTELELGNAHPARDILSPFDGLAICKVVGVQGLLPLLSYEINGSVLIKQAIAVVGSPQDFKLGSLVCAAFDQNRSDRPIVLGGFACDVSKSLGAEGGAVISDDKQITLQCGKASIRLSADGTVAIRGTNVASRASQTNRIRGGNVQIN